MSDISRLLELQSQIKNCKSELEELTHDKDRNSYRELVSIEILSKFNAMIGNCLSDTELGSLVKCFRFDSDKRVCCHFIAVNGTLNIMRALKHKDRTVPSYTFQSFLEGLLKLFRKELKGKVCKELDFNFGNMNAYTKDMYTSYKNQISLFDMSDFEEQVNSYIKSFDAFYKELKCPIGKGSLSFKLNYEGDYYSIHSKLYQYAGSLVVIFEDADGGRYLLPFDQARKSPVLEGDLNYYKLESWW